MVLMKNKILLFVAILSGLITLGLGVYIFGQIIWDYSVNSNSIMVLLLISYISVYLLKKLDKKNLLNEIVRGGWVVATLVFTGKVIATAATVIFVYDLGKELINDK